MSQQYWSEVINQTDTTITIHHGLAAINVNDGGNPSGGVNVYVFNPEDHIWESMTRPIHPEM
ncbi:MAG: hypothetical protein DRG25_05760 [Deltaproteobacteria bacterium]|nr:MAG: hypothetical protein DRG25_05760 [Deltaproteobacteria bacterium]